MTEGEALDLVDAALSNLASIYKHLLNGALECHHFDAAVMALKNALQEASKVPMHIQALALVEDIVLVAELCGTGEVPIGKRDLHSRIADIETIRDWIWE